MKIDLKGQTALVTGSTRGIGRATAEALREAGARVIVHGRSGDATREVARTLRMQRPELARVFEAAAELDTEAGCESLVERVMKLTGGAGVDILVNNAGLYERSTIEVSSHADWMRAYEVNVMSGQVLTQRLTPMMRERGRGTVVWVASESGVQVPDPLLPHYGASKAAQIMTAKSWAVALTGTGVSSVAILPGPTLTDGNVQAADDLVAAGRAEDHAAGLAAIVAARPPLMLGRWASPQEVAAWIVFLASPAGQLATGATINVSNSIHGIIP